MLANTIEENTRRMTLLDEAMDKEKQEIDPEQEGSVLKLAIEMIAREKGMRQLKFKSYSTQDNDG